MDKYPHQFYLKIVVVVIMMIVTSHAYTDDGDEIHFSFQDGDFDENVTGTGLTMMTEIAFDRIIMCSWP